MFLALYNRFPRDFKSPDKSLVLGKRKTINLKNDAIKMKEEVLQASLLHKKVQEYGDDAYLFSSSFDK